MKNLIILLIVFLTFSIDMQAQVIPAGMKYQAVARDLKGQVLANKEISLQIGLFTNEETKSYEYKERHQITTNELGLFTITIGEGNALKGSFKEVPWSKEQVWVELAIDDRGGDDFVIVHSSSSSSLCFLCGRSW